MARSNPLTTLARHVAADLASGGPGEGLAMAMAVLGRLPDAAEQLFDLILAESRRKRPDGEMIEALALMLGQALESLRFEIENGHDATARRVDALSARLLALVDDDTIDTDILLLLVRQVIVAGLDPGDTLRERLVERVGTDMPDGADGGNPAEQLADIAAGVDDEFALFGLLQEMTGALPDEHRALLAASAFAPTLPPSPGLDRLREASVGWLLDPSAAVRPAVAALLGDAAKRAQVSGTMLRRMIALRNWLPEAERPALDGAIRAARAKPVAVTPVPPADLREAFASGWDGAGAQSLFLVVKDGRRFAMVSLLLKQGFGLRDAWVQRGGTRRDIDGLIGDIADQVGLVPTSADYVARAVACGLGINAASGVLPPFGLLDALEAAGLSSLQPESVTIEELLESLGGAAESGLLDGQEGRLALLASESWPLRHPVTNSWFEDGPAVEDVLGRKRIARDKAVGLILDGVLEARRRVWAERMAWTAAALRPATAGGTGKAAAGGSRDWMDFALVARALLDGKALRDIPIMVVIAGATVDAAKGRPRR